MPVILFFMGYGLFYLALRPYYHAVSDVLTMFSHPSNLAFSGTPLSQIYDPNAVKVVETMTTEEEAPDGIPIAQVDMPDSGMYYAQLTCERINMDVPLYWGSNDETLRNGAGQYLGSFMPGFGKPILIAGHNHTYFNCLQYLEVDDVVTVDTNYDTYEYRIYDIQTMSAYDFEKLINEQLGADEELFVMYTCYPFRAIGGRSRNRIIFYGERISGTDVIWRNTNG